MKTALTEREKQIVQVICAGKTNRQISAELDISIHTVDEHIQNIYRKWNVNNRVDLFREALILGEITCHVPHCQTKTKD